MLAFVLSMSGAEIKSAATALEALEALKVWRPDVLVSDIGLPGEDGYALIRTIRDLRPEYGWNIPALALTGYAGSDEGGQAIAAGFQMHLAKPAEPNKLVNAIATVVRRSSKSILQNLTEILAYVSAPSERDDTQFD